MRRVRWKRKNVRDQLAAGGQLTHTKERPVRTADKIQKSPASCADRCSLNNCILASAGMAFIWLQRGHHLLLFPLPLSILWGWFPKAGAEAHPFLLRGVSKGESGEAPPGAEQASRFRGSPPVGRRKAAGSRLVRRCSNRSFAPLCLEGVWGTAASPMFLVGV